MHTFYDKISHFHHRNIIFFGNRQHLCNQNCNFSPLLVMWTYTHTHIQPKKIKEEIMLWNRIMIVSKEVGMLNCKMNRRFNNFYYFIGRNVHTSFCGWCPFNSLSSVKKGFFFTKSCVMRKKSKFKTYFFCVKITNSQQL